MSTHTDFLQPFVTVSMCPVQQEDWSRFDIKFLFFLFHIPWGCIKLFDCFPILQFVYLC